MIGLIPIVVFPLLTVILTSVMLLVLVVLLPCWDNPTSTPYSTPAPVRAQRRTSAAKAGLGLRFYVTAEAVTYKDPCR